MRRLDVIVCTLLILVVVISGCGINGSSKLKTEYTVDEFLELTAPCREASSEALKNATKDKALAATSEAYAEALKELGFKDGMEFELQGKLSFANITDKKMIALHIYNSDQSEFVGVDGDLDTCGWVKLLENYSDVSIRFSIEENEDEGYKRMIFGNAEILSPAMVEYSDNCKVDLSSRDYQCVFGEIKDIYTSNLSKEELEEASESVKSDINLWSWYQSFLTATYYLVLEDSSGHQVGAFVDSTGGQDFDIGDRIACKGKVYSLEEDELPDAFLTNAMDCYYVYK